MRSGRVIAETFVKKLSVKKHRLLLIRKPVEKVFPRGISNFITPVISVPVEPPLRQPGRGLWPQATAKWF
jgi:hypothetical protein